MVQLAIQHGSISSNTVSDLLSHPSNKFMAARIHSNGFEDLFLPGHKTVPPSLQLPELWLSPAPDVLLGVELRAIGGPRSQKSNVGCCIGPLCRRCPQQFSPSSKILKEVFPGNVFFNQGANVFFTITAHTSASQGDGTGKDMDFSFDAANPKNLNFFTSFQ